jgi:hypothetical protein
MGGAGSSEPDDLNPLCGLRIAPSSNSSDAFRLLTPRHSAAGFFAPNLDGCAVPELYVVMGSMMGAQALLPHPAGNQAVLSLHLLV